LRAAAIVTVSADYLAYVIDQLAELGGVSSRRMFGGAGLYCHEYFFGLISADTFYLRVDDSNRADYAVRGMGQFRPYADRPQVSMSYYEVPADVLEDPRLLAAWAARSVEVARSVAAARPARRTGRRTRAQRRNSGARTGR
jgi:DNA transformation protein and related proteins